ncbi:MAG: exodeoxyribonuclease III [Azospira sp.]|jgi:exodeoxyribonuclease-3|nr:exodeoxyribonuclease III [Azospira sp.]
MKIATWNVNSLKVRLPQVLDWLAAHQPDALCLQELKLEDKAFPLAEIEAAGYRAAFSGQKTYNGVAILARTPLADVACGIPGFADEQKRVIAATVGDVRLVCAYFPNGQAVGSEKFAYKLDWLRALTAWLGDELARYPKLALLGDYNIAPESRDAHPDWQDEIHVSAPERESFRALTALGLADAFRLFEQAEKSFSWWDYRMMAFRRNFGLRIDHILLSPPLAAACTACHVDKAPRKLERPSDHAPVIAEIGAVDEIAGSAGGAKAGDAAGSAAGRDAGSGREDR